MGTHPNAILMAVFTPDGLSRKTFRAICEETGADPEGGKQVKIDGDEYHLTVMEESYDEGWQISAPEGSIVVFDLFTYGYGATKEWGELAKQKESLEAWANGICQRHQCTVEFRVTANYW